MFLCLLKISLCLPNILLVSQESWSSIALMHTSNSIKPWPKGFAGWCKSMQILDLHLVWPPSCIDFGRAQICTQVDTSLSPFGHPMQVGAHWSQVNCIQYVWSLRLFVTGINLGADLWIRLATHRSLYVIFGFANLHLVFYFYEQCNIGVLSSVHACNIPLSVHACNLPDLTHYLWDFKGAVETWQYICISGCWPGQIWQNNIKGVTTGFDE